jgi:hypothetical protein
MLAVLTSVVGSAIVFLLMQRQRDARMQRLERQARDRASHDRLAQQSEARERQQSDTDPGEAQDSPLALLPPGRPSGAAAKIGGEALPTGDLPMVPPDAASLPRICPECGSRYAFSVRVCSRDQNELSAVN